MKFYMQKCFIRFFLSPSDDKNNMGKVFCMGGHDGKNGLKYREKN